MKKILLFVYFLLATLQSYSIDRIIGEHMVCLNSVVPYTCTTPGGVWISSNPSVLPIDPITGIAYCASYGSSMIMYIVGPDTSFCISYATNAICGISGTNTVCVNSKINLETYTFYPGFYRGYRPSWSISDTAIAHIEPVGFSAQITGVSNGTAIVTYLVSSGCQVFDTITVSSASCSGTPVAGEASIGSSDICSGYQDTLKISGFTDCGTEIQWQSSPDSIAWTDMPGATFQPAKVRPLTTGYYRSKVTCSTSGLSAYTNVVRNTKRNGITGHSVLSTPDSTCTASRFCIKVCGASNTLNLETSFGDGASDTVNVTNTDTCNAQLTHLYSAPGTYTVKHVLLFGAERQDSITYSVVHDYCKMLPIKFYVDTNGNCSKDAFEPYNLLPINTEIDSNGVPIDTISATSGFYYRALGSPGDIYTFRPLSVPTPLTLTCPTTFVLSDTINSIINNYPTKYFGLTCSGGTGQDLSINANTRCTPFSTWSNIYINNTSCALQGGQLKMHVDTTYTFYRATVAPDSIVRNDIYWTIPPISLFTPTIYIYCLFFNTGRVLSFGDLIHTNFIVTPLVGDIDTVNNRCVRTDTVRASYDPNMIEVNPEGLIIPCTELTYTVHFENTGNDTAYNVHVMDTLPPYVDAKTLEMVYASAPMNLVSLAETGQNVVKFDFPNIKLWDSSHKDKNKGMFVFKIKVKNGLADGIRIPNRVGIYFDHNDVVMTNTVENKIGMEPIVGPDTVCLGSNIMLATKSKGGVWSNSNANTTVDGGKITGINTGKDTISYTISNPCTSRSRTKVITILPVVVPSVSINLPTIAPCAGSAITLTTTLQNGGDEPMIRWQINGTNAHTGAEYTYTPNNRDVAKVEMTSSLKCASPATTSDADTITVAALPTLTLVSKLGTIREAGKTDTFTASGTDLGLAPTYQWYINGIGISGASNAVFITNQLADGDTVSCKAILNGACSGVTAAMVISIMPSTAPTLTPNPNKGTFTIKGQLGSSSFTGTAQIAIKNAVGQNFYSGTAPVTNGIINQTLQLDANIARGIYIATLKANGAMSVIKFVVE